MFGRDWSSIGDFLGPIETIFNRATICAGTSYEVKTAKLTVVEYFVVLLHDSPTCILHGYFRGEKLYTLLDTRDIGTVDMKRMPSVAYSMFRNSREKKVKMHSRTIQHRTFRLDNPRKPREIVDHPRRRDNRVSMKQSLDR